MTEFLQTFSIGHCSFLHYFIGVKNKGYNLNIWRPAMFKVFTALHTSHTQMMDLIRFSQPSAAHILKNIDFLGVSLFGGSLGGVLKKPF